MVENITVKGTEVPPLVVPATKDNPPAQATTTSEEDLHSAGQRKINLIWEITQAIIANLVVGTVLFVAARIALIVLVPNASEKAMGVAITAFVLLSNLASLVIGFYFGRTNHQKVGGVLLGR